MPTLKLPDQKKLLLWGGLGGIVLAFLGGLWFGLRTLMALDGQAQVLQKRIEEAQSLIGYTSTLDTKELKRELAELDRRLETPLRISNLVQEIGERGTEHSVDIVSVEPSPPGPEGHVPVRLSLEGTFENLGKFLGSLDNLNSALVRVQSFDLTGGEDEVLLKMSAEIELYIAEAPAPAGGEA